MTRKKTAAKPLERPGSSDASASEPREGPTGLPFPVVGVGASAGGLEAFSELLEALPADTGLALVLVQHLDPTHKSQLPEILSRSTGMPVQQAEDGMQVQPNHVYVIPPGKDMVIAHGRLRLTPRTGKPVPWRAADHFLRSLASEQGHLAIGVVLSGTAADGTLGLEEIKASGGITFAQDSSAQHDGMPRSAAAAGCVDFVLSPAEIAQEIARIARHPYVDPSEAVGEATHEKESGRILELLHNTTAIDFSNYKRNTLYRRIARRVVLHKLAGVREYLGFLRENRGEIDALVDDILISVTSFFRNPEAFDFLKSTVFPQLLKDRPRHEPVRLWSLGCSTGEEAYSLAIAFTEFAEENCPSIPLHVFATDLNGGGIEKARAGRYSRAIAHDVSSRRLRRFFEEVDGGYRVSKAIRDKCVFAQHNVLAAPPFSNIDLVGCRNLLIYLEPVLQQRLLPVLHYALKPRGFLWLGTSETIGAYRDLFELQDAKFKVYAKRLSRRLAPGIALTDLAPVARAAGAKRARAAEPRVAGTDLQREADRLLLNRYSPPGVLVNEELEILQFRGDTAPFLAPAPGRASLNLLKMLREGLMVGVRKALQRARKEHASVREQGLRVRSGSGLREVVVEVIPVAREEDTGPCFLVVFEERAAREPARERAIPAAAATPPSRAGEGRARGQVAQLTEELSATREYLQSVIEQQEAANEELQSANEEVQSTNEELQSINEELETSKEEIQSTNEELATVNDELQHRNLELTQSNNDLLNLLASMPVAVVMLGANLDIRRFTPMAEKLLNIIPTDVGRPITDIHLNVIVPDFEALLGEVISSAQARELEVQDAKGAWHLLRLRPYNTGENRIDGAVLTLVDIDSIKRNEQTVRRQAELLEQTREPIIIWDFDSGSVTYWNRGAEETYGYSRAEALGRQAREVLASPLAPHVLRDVLGRDGTWKGETVYHSRDGAAIDVEVRLTLVRNRSGQASVIETIHPITERKRMEEAMRQKADTLLAADRSRNEFLAMLAHELRNPLAPLHNAAQLLGKPGLDEATAARLHEMLKRQLRRMARLIDDLLDLARVTRGQVQVKPRPVQLGPLLQRTAEAAQSRLDGRKQELRLVLPPEPVWLDADSVRLEQVFDNLIDNASKFSPEGGCIEVTAVRVEPAAAPEPGAAAPAAGVEVRFKDHGIGLERSMLESVFEPFVQVDQTAHRPYGGLGLGLTLVRRIVEQHGGQVEALSQGLGSGCEFVVRLPVRPPPPREKTPMPKSSTKSRRILIVDDNVDAAETLALLLRLERHDVRVSHDGPASLEAAREFKPDTALLDIGLPGMDGLELARRIRSVSSLSNILLVAITGYGRESDRRLSRNAGFDEHLTKPVDVQGLLGMLEKHSAG